MTTITTIVVLESLLVSDPRTLVDIGIEQLTPRPNDLLISIKAVSVNPVDVKLRRGHAAATPRILSFDAAGVVVNRA